MAETIQMPKLGFDMAEGSLVRWVKKEGETIQKGEILAEIETDKATVEVESPASGVLRRLLVDEGAVVPVNTPIAIVGTADENIDEMALQKSQTPVNQMTASETPVSQMAKVESQPMPVGDQKNVPAGGPVKASPLAKKVAREKSVDLSRVQGSGPGGRIVRRDIEAVLASPLPPVLHPAGAAGFAPGQLAGRETDETIVPSKLRQAIGRRMAEAKSSIPHFYVTHEYKMDALLEMRAQYNKIVPESEKVSVNDLIIKAAALTLRQFPALNASLNGNSVLLHGQVNVGAAVSVEGGLLTVVCKEADKKTLRQIAAEMKTMAARVREGKVHAEDIEGSTFSISNLGMYEVENFTAIINPPEAAILAVGSARQVPVVEEGAIRPGWRMKATLAVDHRLSDGVEAAKFMQALAVYLEEPLRLVV